MEKTMRLLILEELLRLTRAELCDLWQWIANELPNFEAGPVERSCEPAQHPLGAVAAGLRAAMTRTA
jgi:hypothetical protein